MIDTRLTEKAQADNFLKGKQEQALQSALKNIDHPSLMEDSGDKIESVARDLIKKGYSPKVAADSAAMHVENETLRAAVSGNNGTGSQSMVTGSKQQVKQEKEPAISDAMIAQMNKDIAQGIFKDEAEWRQYNR